jgi:hypothetical protein
VCTCCTHTYTVCVLVTCTTQGVTTNDTAPHNNLVTTGVSYTGADGNNILFSTTDCLCTNQVGAPHQHCSSDVTGGILLRYFDIHIAAGCPGMTAL